MDDTILAYDSVADPVWEAVCRANAPALNVDAEDLYRALRRCNDDYWRDAERYRWGRLHLDDARTEIVRQALDDLGIVATPRVVRLAREIGVAFNRGRNEGMFPFPGAIEALHLFRRREVRLGLVTNGASANQRRKIDRFGLEPLFDCIVIEGEYGAGKPDGRIFFHALEQLDAGPDDAWMVGDDLACDIAGAQGAGILAVWVDVRGCGVPRECAVRPDRVVRGLAELVDDER